MHASRADIDDLRDHDLVRQVVQGSQDALAALYDRHAPAVFQSALRLDRDRGVAEEVVQETFLALWNRAEQFDPERGSLGAWLGTIARNRAIDRRRASARHQRAEPFSVAASERSDEAATVDWLVASGTPIAAGAPDPQPDELLASRETVAAVAAAIALLSDDERQAVLLAYRDGLSQSEIAGRLGWPLGTVKTRSRRALRRLRHELERTRSAPVVPSAPSPRRPSAQAVAGAKPCMACG